MPRLSSGGVTISTELDVMAEIGTVNADSCCPVSRVSVRAILAPLLWEERVVDECGAFSFGLYVSEGTVLVSSKRPVLAELLSKICPLGS